MLRKVRVLVGLFSLIILVGAVVYTARWVKPVVAINHVPKILRVIPNRPHGPVCGNAAHGSARCHARVVTDNGGKPLGTLVPAASSYGPGEFHTAYNLPCTPGGPPLANCATPTTYGPQIIAIIDAYHAPKIENDLNTYAQYYGVPPCYKATGCLSVVNENGGTTLSTRTNSSWALETTLDVEVAHMVCQTCKILLVEANSSSFQDMGMAVKTAAALGATAISNSYGGSEWSGESSADAAYFNHPGIAVIASSGDSGYGTAYPAASPNVVAVGGTTLTLNTDNTYAQEAVWAGTGSGCSRYLPANSWQKNLANWSQTKCGTYRAENDVAADGDPNTGAAVYDSTPYNGATGWYQVGGTSLATPLIAGVYALTGGVPAAANATMLPYTGISTSNLYDITTGSNGNCTSIMCRALGGYDGPTGLGSPNGLTAFGMSLATPFPSPTPTLSPTPTPTALPTETPTPGPSPTPTVTPEATPTPTVTPTPTAQPSPTPTPTSQPSFIFGYQTIGPYTDTYDRNYLDGSRFKMGPVNGTLQSISAYVAAVQSAPNNVYQVAMYTDAGGRPGTLVAQANSGTLAPNSWNTLPLQAPLTANADYWLMYNTNATSSSLNNLRFTLTSSSIGSYSATSVTFGTWPTTFTANLDGYEYSLYATYTTP